MNEKVDTLKLPHLYLGLYQLLRDLECILSIASILAILVMFLSEILLLNITLIQKICRVNSVKQVLTTW